MRPEGLHWSCWSRLSGRRGEGSLQSLCFFFTLLLVSISPLTTSFPIWTFRRGKSGIPSLSACSPWPRGQGGRPALRTAPISPRARKLATCAESQKTLRVLCDLFTFSSASSKRQPYSASHRHPHPGRASLAEALLPCRLLSHPEPERHLS